MSLKPILLIEDNSNDAELIQIALEQNGQKGRTLWIGDGTGALDFFQIRGEYRDRPPGNPSLVLLDLKMPKIDGKEVLRFMRSRSDLAHIPVVIFSSSKEANDVRDCLRQGANAFVVKPLDFHEMQKVVGSVTRFWLEHNIPPPGSVPA